MIKRLPLVVLILSFSVLISLACNKKGPLLNDPVDFPLSALVDEAIDGDTVRIRGGRLVRYIGIDAPELRRKVNGSWIYEPAPFSREAYELNRRLVEGKSVRLEYDEEKSDKYKRALAYVYAGDILVNGEIVKAGLARASIYRPNTKYADLLIKLEKDAKMGKRGIWGENKQ